MRPVRLTMQAFGPYPEREVIDFRDAVKVGLFGVYGPTGSGKSTIFSAMTFALFGESAKTDQEASSLRSDHAEPGVNTEVEFVFDIGKQRYVVLRRPDQTRPKQRGSGETKNPHEAFLFEATDLALDDINDERRGKIIAEKKVRDVDAAISEILGYGSSQFRQIVLLPQGRFEMFLSAKTKERVEILRDLFDVSIYRSLAIKLKKDADVAERGVRTERELCARRLTADGFESTDALTVGISNAETRHVILMESEKTTRAALDTALTTVREGEKIEAQFKAAEDAQSTLAAFEGYKENIDTLAERVTRTERASSLLDIEANVAGTAAEVRDAEERHKQSQSIVVETEVKEKLASEILKREADRSGEIEALRQKIGEFERHQQTLEKAKDVSAAVEKAQLAESVAARNLSVIKKRLSTLQENEREKTNALKTARVTDRHRQELLTRLSILKSSLAIADTFERIEANITATRTEVLTLIAVHGESKRLADIARKRFEATEQSFVGAQALHLASKLQPGRPCSVCGSIEHPDPATGMIEHSTLDQVFREAKAAWQMADAEAREVEQKLIRAQSILQERQNQLSSLEHPDASTTVIRDKVEAEQNALDALGEKVNIVEAEAEIEQLKEKIDSFTKEYKTLHEILIELQQKVVTENVRLEEMLSVVPETLRNQDVLAADRKRATELLTTRRTAKENAEEKATAAREAVLVAHKDQQAADNTLSSSRERYGKALETFQSRLERVSLSVEDFNALKPFIATIDEDRATLNEYRRKLDNAKETAKRATEAIRKQVRPDLLGIKTKWREAEEKLTEATNQRSAAGHQLDRLTKLRDDLTETLRKLDEAEAVSGPLRNLALLVNGDNSQKLELETFAIGVMFDQVLEAANHRLGPMTANRYRLERDLEGSGRGRRGLGTQVFDIFTGKARPTTTLSGGETFIAALALALGLADIVESTSGKIRLDTIFIDEGFGSLDTENGSGTLDQVLQVLNSLVCQNRAVGLISHVPLVQEAIPNGFYVTKSLAGSSVKARGVV